MLYPYFRNNFIREAINTHPDVKVIGPASCWLSPAPSTKSCVFNTRGIGKATLDPALTHACASFSSPVTVRPHMVTQVRRPYILHSHACTPSERLLRNNAHVGIASHCIAHQKAPGQLPETARLGTLPAVRLALIGNLLSKCKS